MSLLAPPYPLEVYKQRRERLAQFMRDQGGGIAIIPNGEAAMRSQHTALPFRFDSQFFYLSGFTEQNAWLVLQVDDEHTRSLLFCSPKNPHTETWDGLMWGPAAAREAFGFDEALGTDELDDWMSQRLALAPSLFLPLQRCAIDDLTGYVQQWLAQSRQQLRLQSAHAPTWHDLTPVLAQMRQIKDAHELATMRRAAQISAHAHRRAMQTDCIGLSERALEAQLLHTFLISGAQGAAYDTIVATGINACTLHHRAGHDIIGADDLILIDAGCELDGYAADITRTFPASGRFTGPQAALYDIVLSAQEAATDATKPGAGFDDAHQAAVRTLTQGLVDEGLLKGNVDGLIEAGAYQRFYMHRTGHWLGLDVHDVGPLREPLTANARSGQDSDWIALAPGMVVTIEPGLYIPSDPDIPQAFHNIGIRIEDDAIVTEQGCDLITRDVPVKRDAIEELMRERRAPES